jgi:exonuclease SbcD
MRFLHTADWHVGKTLYGRSRLDEQEQVIAEILDITRRDSIDCVLLAGDIFESLAPTGDAERVVCDALAEFAGAGIAVIVVGGNHDHPRRLGALRKLGDPLRIFIRPDPCPPSNGGVVEIVRHKEKAVIGILPWVPEFKIVDICKMMGPEDSWYEAYSDNVAAMCRILASSFTESTINILTAHLFTYGAETSGSERAVHVAAPFAVKREQFPQSAQYIALGHIHKPQEIAVGGRCFYSGCPLQLDFGERDQQKRVIVVDAKPHFPASIDSIDLIAGRRLREIHATMEMLPALAQQFAGDFLRVVVESPTRLSGLAQQVTDLFPNALDIRQNVPEEKPETQLPEDRASASPVELFTRYVSEEKGKPPSPEMLTRFEELYAEASHAPAQA